MSKSNCMQKNGMIITQGDFHSSSSSFENTNLANRSSNELEILHVSRFPSDLVHRHIVFLLTLLLLEKMMIIISPDIIMQPMLMSKQVNHVNSGPEILHGNWTSSWKV